MFTKDEMKLFRELNSPQKVQNFLNSLKMNFEENGETCFSPRMVLKNRKAHCIEGALFAATVLRFHGSEPLVLDLESTKKDFDHVVALFKKGGHWGAISKTNHAVLRYREPVYRTIRELAMSYFHEYFLDDGKKTLRKFSTPVNLEKFDKFNWMTSEEDVWFVAEYLAKVRHFDILNRAQIAGLRKADDIEVVAGKLVGEKAPKGTRNSWG